MPSNVVMAVGHQVIDNGGKVLLLSVRRHQEAILQSHVEGDLGWSQEHAEAGLIAREEMVPISKIEGIDLSKFANNELKNVCATLRFQSLGIKS